LELNYEEFTALFTRFDREAIHLEMRDSYGTAVELPHMAKWAAGEADDLDWLRPWCDEVRANVAQGKVYRRVHRLGQPGPAKPGQARPRTSPPRTPLGFRG